MGIKKAAKVLSYSPPEFLIVCFSAGLLFGAWIYTVFFPSSRIISRIQKNQPPFYFPLLSFFRRVKKTRVVSLLEAVDQNLFFRPSCLRRMVALAWFCRLMGSSARFIVAADRSQGVFAAHCWCESDGIKLEMGTDSSTFTPFLASH